jgi:hypothetical protein
VNFGELAYFTRALMKGVIFMKNQLKSASEFTLEMHERINKIASNEELEEVGEALDELASADLITSSQYMFLEDILDSKMSELVEKGLI